jgi:altronate hydrolase
VIFMDTITASPLIRLHANDNVLIARQPIALGQELPEFGLRVQRAGPAGHKIAAARIAAGEPVRKYDTVIGFAGERHRGRRARAHAQPALRGFDRDPSSAPTCGRSTAAPEDRGDVHGHRAPDGRVATRNYIGILSSVNCSATVSRKIAEQLHRERLAPIRTSTASSPSRTTPAAACRRRASTSTSSAARWPATRASEPGRGADRRPRLRAQPDRRPAESQGLQQGRSCVTMNMQDTGGTRETIAAGVAAIESCCPRPTTSSACR